MADSSDMDPKGVLIGLICGMPQKSHAEIVRQLPQSLNITEANLDREVNSNVKRFILRDYLTSKEYIVIRNSEFSPWIELMLLISTVAAGLSVAGIAPLIKLLYQFRTSSANIKEEQGWVLIALTKDRGNFVTLDKIGENLSRLFPKKRRLLSREIEVLLTSLESVVLKDDSIGHFVVKSNATPPSWRILDV